MIPGGETCSLRNRAGVKVPGPEVIRLSQHPTAMRKRFGILPQGCRAIARIPSRGTPLSWRGPWHPNVSEESSMRSVFYSNRFGRAGLTLAAMAFAYALAPIGSASAYTLNTMHSFCAEASNCGDGDTPLAGLVEDSAGNFYGVTEKGGKYNSGLVFKLVPNGQNTYKEFILHNFCARTNCTDGGFPENAELILDTDGNLYGTTGSGGAHDAGVVFKL